MPYNKKVFQDGGVFTASDANFIQTQYDAAVNELRKSQAEFSLALKTETFEGNGMKNFYRLEQSLITQPIVSVKRLADSNFLTETVSLFQTTDWTYTINSTDVYHNDTILLPGEFVRISYLLKIFPHASTHSYIPEGEPTEGKDELKIENINGYNKKYIDDKFADLSGGITSGDAEAIAKRIKEDTTVPAVIRTVRNLTDLLVGEIAIYSPLP